MIIDSLLIFFSSRFLTICFACFRLQLYSCYFIIFAAYCNIAAFLCNVDLRGAEMEMGQWVMGHGSNGSPFLDGSRGSWVNASDPLTHDDEITTQ